MKMVCVSVYSLYKEFGDELQNCHIAFENDSDGFYCDLMETEQGLVCMDGEGCEILEENESDYLLQNSHGELTTQFRLTKEEFETATYSK